MKTFRLCLTALVACMLLVACKNESASFTPYIQFSYFYLNPVFEGDEIVSADDTLSYTAVQGAYVLDTIDIADRVVFAVGFGSYSNDLISARITCDTNQLFMQAKLSNELQAILLPTSNLRTLQLYINPGFNYLSFPADYIPLQSGSHHIRFLVESDSELSPHAVELIQPVR